MNLLAGSTGFLGSKILNELSLSQNKTLALSRRMINTLPKNTEQLIIDFKKLSELELPQIDHVFLSLGYPLLFHNVMGIKMNNVVMGAVALVVGAGVGFVIGQGEKEVVEVEKIVEVEAAKVSTLEAVKAKGFVQCGVSQGLPGFSNADDSGKWTGLDVDLCRAVAAVIFGYS